MKCQWGSYTVGLKEVSLFRLLARLQASQVIFNNAYICCNKNSHRVGLPPILDWALQCRSNSECKTQCKWSRGSNLQPACLTWPAGAVCCRFSHLLLLQASCLPAPCRCLSMDYTLSACLHVALQLLPRRLAEQASLLDGHCGANEETASFYTKTDLWERCSGFGPCFSFF